MITKTEAIIRLFGLTLAAIIVCIFITPWLSFWLAYFGGWIAKITIGKYLVDAFSYFNIDLPLDKIPLIAGLIGWISGFFSRFNKTNKNDND